MTKGSEDEATAEEAYQVWKAVLRLQALMVSELERRTEEAGVIPPTWLDLLLKLGHAPERRLRMSELAESAFLSRGGVTRLAIRVEAAGLLRREPCPDDGRGAFAVLTDAGSEALRRAGPVYRETLTKRFVAHLTGSQARAAAKGLEAILVGNDWVAPATDQATWHSPE